MTSCRLSFQTLMNSGVVRPQASQRRHRPRRCAGTQPRARPVAAPAAATGHRGRPPATSRRCRASAAAAGRPSAAARPRLPTRLLATRRSAARPGRRSAAPGAERRAARGARRRRSQRSASGGRDKVICLACAGRREADVEAALPQPGERRPGGMRQPARGRGQFIKGGALWPGDGIKQDAHLAGGAFGASCRDGLRPGGLRVRSRVRRGLRDLDADRRETRRG